MTKKAEDEKRKLDEDKMLLGKTKMKEEIYLQFPSPLINRRYSMPEELMRKYFVMKQKTSEESETNKTMDEIPSSTSSKTLETEAPKKTAVLRPTMTKWESPNVVNVSNVEEENCFNAEPTPPVSETSTRDSRSDISDRGRSAVEAKEKGAEVYACTCEGDKASSTSVSFKEETNETTAAFSAPTVRLPKRESFSDNPSSESDCTRCTCRELTSSKETSTDVYLCSGKSTLSQTVSEKSLSTQDSTLSINSVSTRGSTASDESNVTTPDAEGTSAKESTPSDRSPKTPRTDVNRKNRRNDRDDDPRTCPKHNGCPDDSEKGYCTVHPKGKGNDGKSWNANANDVECFDRKIENPDETAETRQANGQTVRMYTWAKLSQDELYMMQQLRHRKLVESRFAIPADDSTEPCDIYSSECDEESIMIPRYSAIPRTLSMLVNTSSTENSMQNSDSDNQSLADSLEDQPIHCVRKFYFDTKNESKPVRGEVNLPRETKQRKRSPKGKAFFVSIRNSWEENEMSEDIERIPQPPEKIKNQINERHYNLSAKHCRLREKRREKKNKQKKRKNGSVENEGEEKRGGTMDRCQRNEGGENNVGKRKNNAPEKEEIHVERDEGREEKVEAKLAESERKKVKEHGGRFPSKIPILVSCRSPERDPFVDGEKKSEKTEKSGSVVETTQILEITKTDNEITLQKPQSLASKPRYPMENVKLEEGNHLTMPPLLPYLKMQTPYRPNLNRQLNPGQTKRSPMSRYRQRFEVIPEEKSSSLSSNEEKNPAETFRKFTNAATSPPPPKNGDNENLTETTEFAKQVKTLPCLKRLDDQKLIIFSSKPKKNANSSKGRDALIAMNRDDFNRLAKGWMNFYKMSEASENSDAENEVRKNGKSFDDKGKDEMAKDGEEASAKSDDGERENSKSSGSKRDAKTCENFQTQTNEIRRRVKKSTKVDDTTEIDEKIQFHSSNTILRTATPISPNNSIGTMAKRQDPPLPNLKAPAESNVERGRSKPPTETLPKVARHTEDGAEYTDSDSTDYMEPPSPRVPPLALEDFPSDGTLSSSEGEGEGEKDESKPRVMIESCQHKKRGVTDSGGPRQERFVDVPRFGRKKQPGWSVTVAGTVKLSKSAPDLEMRLSFPAKSGQTVSRCQSDSGFADDSNNYSKPNESMRDSTVSTSGKEISSVSENSSQKWTVTIQDPNQGEIQNRTRQKSQRKLRHHRHFFPDLEPSQTRNTKKVLKKMDLEKSLRKVISRKLHYMWPKVREIVREEFLTVDERLATEFPDPRESLLSVTGTAVPLEKKEKPLSMTQRDVTGRYTPRTTNSSFPNRTRSDEKVAEK